MDLKQDLDFPKVPRPHLGRQKRLRSYNQFPLHYENIAAMAADLPRIAALGFSSVWVNPLFEPCQNTDWISAEIARGLEGTNPGTKDFNIESDTGSPYAIKSFDINQKISAHSATNLSNEQRRKKDYADIRQYTKKAKQLRLTPVYDFVMRHVAVDSPLVAQHPEWFKKHSNGNFLFFGRDENYHSTGQAWDDVLELNFDDPKTRDEIIEQHLKPMAAIVIKQLGFEGLRIDAAGKIPIEVYDRIMPYVDYLCMKTHGKPALIMGETLGRNVDEFRHLRGVMDYVYNSIYFCPFSKEFWDLDDTPLSYCKGILQAEVSPTIGFAGNHDVPRLAWFYHRQQHIRGTLLKKEVTDRCINGSMPLEKVRNIFVSLNDQRAFDGDVLKRIVATAVRQGVTSGEEAEKACAAIDEKGILPQKYLRNWFNGHPLADSKASQTVFKSIIDAIFNIVEEDKQKEYNAAKKGEQKTKKRVSEQKFIDLLGASTLDEADLRHLIKEAFYITAFASDGGWFFSLGDEWAVTKKTNVFRASPEDLKERARDNLDFSETIREINNIVRQLPPPANPEWVQRCYLQNTEMDHALTSFLIHQGHGFSQPPLMVIANTSEENQVIDCETFRDILSANGRNNTPEKKVFPNRIYICGSIEMDPELVSTLKCIGAEVFFSGNAPIHLPARPSSGSIVDRKTRPTSLDV